MMDIRIEKDKISIEDHNDRPGKMLEVLIFKSKKEKFWCQ